ncbi:hypothetical protein PAMP_004282 [Pampus punctatissimus]
MDFVQLPDRITDKSAVRDKKQEDSAAVRGRRHTPADFSSISSKGERLFRDTAAVLLTVTTGGSCQC